MKNSEDAVRFAHDRLHHRRAGGLLGSLLSRRTVTRRFVLGLDAGRSETIEQVDDSIYVRCVRGSVWITHDGDPKDIILYPGESYRAEREEAMHISALQNALLELEFEDDAVIH